MAYSEEANAAFEARRDGTSLPLVPNEMSDEQALAAHLAVADLFAQNGDQIGGWKIGMTSGAARDAFGESFRPFGFVLDSRVFHTGASVDYHVNLPTGIEPEICVKLATELRGPDVTPEAAEAAVESVAPGFELLEQRVVDSGSTQRATRLIDGLSHWGMVVGEMVPVAFLDRSATCELSCDGELIEKATANDDLVIDDIFLSLSRLANLLHEFGRSVEPGQIVLTGSFAKVPVETPSEWRAAFSGIGGVSVRLH